MNELFRGAGPPERAAGGGVGKASCQTASSWGPAGLQAHVQAGEQLVPLVVQISVCLLSLFLDQQGSKGSLYEGSAV